MKETEKLELKKSTAELTKALNSISAILNKHQKGELYFGIDDSGKIVGQTVGKDTLKDVSKSISDHIEPKVFPIVKESTIQGKSCIYVQFRGKHTPYFAHGRAYIRVGEEDRPMSSKELERFILKKSTEKRKWDKEICEESSLEDIDIKKVKWYLKEREKARHVSTNIKISFKELLINLTCSKDNKPTNAGILFFGKVPYRYFPNARLRVIKFKGNKITNPTLDTVTCEGTLPEIINLSEDFIRKNIRLIGIRSEKSFRREDKFEYPMKALREAVINALIHRNYREDGDVRVFIFDNRIEIINPGTFPEGVSPTHPKHKPVNPIICNLIYDIGLIEKYGSGIAMMNEVSKKWGNKKPHYDIHPVETKIIFESQITESTYIEKSSVDGLNDRQKKGLECLSKKGSMTTKEYVALVKISIITAKRDLLDLKEKKIIKYSGSAKTGYYCLYDTVNKQLEK